MLTITNVCKSKLHTYVLFYSKFVCMSANANVYFKTIRKRIRQINIHRAEVHCGSAFEQGGSGLPYYCTPPVRVPDVLCALAVWRLSGWLALCSKKMSGSSVFTTAHATMIHHPSPLSGVLAATFFPPCSRVLSVTVRIYYSNLSFRLEYIAHNNL